MEKKGSFAQGQGKESREPVPLHEQIGETRQNWPWRRSMVYVKNQNEKNSTVYKAGITKYKMCHECSSWRILQPGHLRFLFGS